MEHGFEKKALKIARDKEDLYDDVIHIKQKQNATLQENVRLKTKVKKLETELNKNEKYIEDLLAIQAQEVSNHSTMLQSRAPSGSHIVGSLKRQLRETKHELDKAQTELKDLKRSLKATKLEEFEIEMKLYVDECT